MKTKVAPLTPFFIVIIISIMTVAAIFILPLLPGAVIMSGQQILKEMVVSADGKTVTSGVWVVSTYINFPTGDVILLKNMVSDLPNGAQAQTKREIRLEFNIHDPYHRALLQEKSFTIETFQHDFYLLYWKMKYQQYRFKYYTFHSWKDTWAAFDVKMYVDGILADSETEILIGPDSNWGIVSGTVEGKRFYSKVILQTPEGEKLDLYALGWLDRGLTPPRTDIAIIWDPYLLRWKYVDRGQLESKMEAKIATAYKKQYDGKLETYTQLYDWFELKGLADLSSSLRSIYEAPLVTPEGRKIWPEGISSTQVFDIGPLKTKVVDYGTRDSQGWAGETAVFDTNVWILGKSGHRFSVNINALILADATLFDTIVWRPGAGIPEIIEVGSPTFISGEAATLEVLVKNMGYTKDSFIGMIQFTVPQFTATLISPASDIPVGGVGTLKFRITGPVQYADIESKKNKVIIRNVGDPIKEDFAYFDLFMKGQTKPETKVASISGYVRDKDTNQGIGEVNVIVEDLRLAASTQPDGYYAIRDIPTGNTTRKISVEYSKPGYKSYIEKNITIEVNKDTRIAVVYLEKGAKPKPEINWLLIGAALSVILILVIAIFLTTKKKKGR